MKQSSPIFSYASESPAFWEDKLGGFKEEENYIVRVPVYWGRHEQLRGIRDFSKSPYLRLEKFFGIAHKLGIKIELVLGFSPSAPSFPVWTFELENKALIGKALREEGDSGFVLTEIPSLYDRQFFDAFVSFLRELSGIVSLYRYPEGPISEVLLDLSLYEADLNAVVSEDYALKLQQLYGDVEKLNRVYRTAFSDFATLSSSRAWRLLSQKRPWLASYDYGRCKRNLFQSVRERIEEISSKGELFNGLKILDPCESQQDRGNKIVMDPVFLDSPESARGFPCFPCGYVNTTVANAFRVWEYMHYYCKKEGISFGFLPLWNETQESYQSPLTVICGHYLTRLAFESLYKFIKRGGQAFFPFGFPKYDESMDCLDWSLGMGDKQLIFDFAKVERHSMGKGAVWVSSSPFEFKEGLWDKVRLASSKIEGVIGK